jgi:hypothetical protein
MKNPFKEFWKGASVEKANLEDALLRAHLGEIESKDADAFNIGSYTDDTTIGSKTDIGYLESKIDAKTKKVTHRWRQ